MQNFICVCPCWCECVGRWARINFCHQLNGARTKNKYAKNGRSVSHTNNIIYHLECVLTLSWSPFFERMETQHQCGHRAAQCGSEIISYGKHNTIRNLIHFGWSVRSQYVCYWRCLQRFDFLHCNALIRTPPPLPFLSQSMFLRHQLNHECRTK